MPTGGRPAERRGLIHVVAGDAQREIVARLYFADTREAETAYRDRLDEQPAYFGYPHRQCWVNPWGKTDPSQ